MKDVRSLFQVAIAMLLFVLYVLLNLVSEEERKPEKELSAKLSSIHTINTTH